MMTEKSVNIINYLRSQFPQNNSLLSKGKYLIIILGSFGDFDSIEYCQILAKNLQLLNKKDINIFVLGIGNSNSRKKFAKYTNLPLTTIEFVHNNEIHNHLSLSDGNYFNLPPIINLLFMCSGVNSPGTLKEVLRGYIGDKRSSSIYSLDEIIHIGTFFSFKASLFKNIGSFNHLKPLELATLRLTNMLEILSNWPTYIPIEKYIVQRGATYIFDEKDKLVYSYRSNSLLSFSETMWNPLAFIEKHIPSSISSEG